MPRVKKTSSSSTSSSSRRNNIADRSPEAISDMKRRLSDAINRHIREMAEQGIIFNTNLPLDELMAPSKKTLINLQNGTGGRKRAQNGFILFRKDNQFRVQAENPEVSQPEISKILKSQWAAAPRDVKNIYMILSSIDFQAHKELFGEDDRTSNTECESEGSTGRRNRKTWKKFATMPQMVLLPVAEKTESSDSFYLQDIYKYETNEDRHGTTVNSPTQLPPPFERQEFASTPQQYHNFIEYTTPTITTYDSPPSIHSATQSCDPFYAPSMDISSHATLEMSSAQENLITSIPASFSQFLYSEIPLIEDNTYAPLSEWPQ
ncbi:13159_t:CDS:1 [Acaulospora colombiana]|uniref:13159_t:CDS:1 n=1 Tax=Acaulospora colombiana TaxID=27376 RepID=A0ACA9L2Z8_9GLOM|nr:13159_t:CDS:1 [Acaulospora colombiana]